MKTTNQKLRNHIIITAFIIVICFAAASIGPRKVTAETSIWNLPAAPAAQKITAPSLNSNPEYNPNSLNGTAVPTINLGGTATSDVKPKPDAPVNHADVYSPPKAKDDPNSSDFSLMWCDGPSLASQPELLAAAKAKNGGRYTACDFAGAVGQIQHLMNIAVILGVLVAIILFSYAGYLMISVSFTGKQDDLKKAKDIFQKVTWGFIIMLVAWFAVYQIIAWLVPTNSPATTLLDQRL